MDAGDLIGMISLFLIPPLGPIGMAITLGIGLLLEKALCLGRTPSSCWIFFP